MNVPAPFESGAHFIGRLHWLRQQRKDRKLELRSRVFGNGLSRAERDEIFIKVSLRGEWTEEWCYE